MSTSTGACEPFNIPAGTRVWPVMVAPNAKLWAGKEVVTHREATYKSFRKLPTDGNFRTFHDRNENGRKFIIALFEKPTVFRGVMVVGCIVDMTELP